MNLFLHEQYPLLVQKLISLQSSRGGFLSVNLTTHESLTTSYFTSLILIALRTLPDNSHTSDALQRIARLGVSFLESGESPCHTWNYFLDQSQSPYPNDLDDTALALLALDAWQSPQKESSDRYEARIAAFAHALITSEQQPGGPYATWIVPHHLRDQWNDYDPVVNGTILKALNHFGIHLESLDEFVSSFIQSITAPDLNHTHSSLYYSDPLVMLYLAPQSVLVRHASGIKKILDSYSTQHPANLSLRFIIARRCNLLNAQTQEALETALRASINEFLSCPTIYTPYAVFTEKITATHHELSGCIAFDCALMLEAIGMACTRSETSLVSAESPAALPAPATHPNTHEQSHKESAHLDLVRETLLTFETQAPATTSFLVHQFDQLILSSERNHLLFPYRYHASLTPDYQETLFINELVICSTIHTIGIIVFTLQDSLVDTCSSSVQLPHITTGTLMISMLIQRLLFRVSDSEDIMNILFEMNETLFCETQQLLVTTNPAGAAPSFSHYRKSLGYLVSPLLILHSGGSCARTELLLLKKYFDDWLYLRQLLDDLHDWYDDLMHEQYNPISHQVVSLFHIQYAHLPRLTCEMIPNHKTELSDIFWNSIIPTIHAEAIRRSTSAREAITRMNLLASTTFLRSEIEYYTHHIDTALANRQSMHSFLHHYKNHRFRW